MVLNLLPWDRGHVGERMENSCQSPPMTFPPGSLALDPSLGVEGDVPPSLEGEGGGLEEGFQAAWSVFFVVINSMSFFTSLWLES